MMNRKLRSVGQQDRKLHALLSEFPGHVLHKLGSENDTLVIDDWEMIIKSQHLTKLFGAWGARIAVFTTHEPKDYVGEQRIKIGLQLWVNIKDKKKHLEEFLQTKDGSGGYGVIYICLNGGDSLVWDYIKEIGGGLVWASERDLETPGDVHIKTSGNWHELIVSLDEFRRSARD